ncbi:MAG: GGDEF domain-containing protein [Acidobacteria bacterium]|nr:GGDEF domain-containing protein [Acidobacteriota bacterium]
MSPVSRSHRRRAGPVLIVLAVMVSPLASLAAQPDPDILVNLESLQDIPAPEPMSIRPRLFAAYGALIAAAMLGILYLYRGRAFIVYWIGSWLLIAGSLMLLSQGYAEVRLGSVMLGLAQLLGVWSAGLMLLGGEAFPNAPLRWNTPLKVAAVTAVWFLAAPFLLPLTSVLATGPAAAGVLFGWSALRYLALTRRTRYVGSFLIGGGLGLMAVSNAAVAGAVLNLDWGAQTFDRLLAFNIVINMFVALGMHVLVFEDMTAELRRTNRDLAEANEEVKRLAITDPLTGCHNRRFFDEIERREMQRHKRYGAPISVVFVDVNHFKRLNDTMGHDTGDAILRMLGTLLRRQVRESDYVIRWGGDEFLLLLTCSLAEAQRKAGDLKRAFDRERATTPVPDGIGLSIGVAAVSPEAESLTEAIRAADSRMYGDKLGSV